MSWSVGQAFQSLLKGFGRTRRPVSWLLLTVGILGMLATLFNIIATGQAKWATLAAFFLIFNDGYGAVADVEDAQDSAASPNKKRGKR